MKKQVAITPDKKIISIPKTVEGKKHDKKLGDEDVYWIFAPHNSKCLADSDYEGFQGSSNLRVIKLYRKSPKKVQIHCRNN